MIRLTLYWLVFLPIAALAQAVWLIGCMLAVLPMLSFWWVARERLSKDKSFWIRLLLIPVELFVTGHGKARGV